MLATGGGTKDCCTKLWNVSLGKSIETNSQVSLYVCFTYTYIHSSWDGVVKAPFVLRVAYVAKG